MPHYGQSVLSGNPSVELVFLEYSPVGDVDRMISSRVQGRARLASIVGGVLWALVAPVFVLLNSSQDGSAARTLLTIAAFGVGVVSLLLLLVGLAPLYAMGATVLGRVGIAGVLVSAIALGFVAVGNGAELVTLTTQGRESEVGHTIFLVALLILIVASILVGQVFARRRWSAGARVGGMILLLALPLGILLLLLGNLVSPTTDLGFWAALTVPYGVGRVLLALST